MESNIYIGLISGTSMDAIDAVAVRFGKHRLEMLGSTASSYESKLRKDIAKAASATNHNVDALGSLHVRIGDAFASAALQLMDNAGIAPDSVTAIGSHGQTIRHRPAADAPFSMQLGDGATIAARTGVTTVCDFRSMDVALGGQGAPLVPAFHGWLFSSCDPRAIVNIGGIGNVTILAQEDVSAGYDTGPGNTLMDAWINRHLNRPFDESGAWAASGTVDDDLLTELRSYAYFNAAPPKSTGPEEFNLTWLDRYLEKARADIAPEDVQATLVELTASTIAQCIRGHANIADVAVCGGGAANPYLMGRLRSKLEPVDTTTTENRGLHPDWVEACAFAWLARTRLEEEPGNIPAVTGASRAAVLGAVYTPA